MVRHLESSMAFLLEKAFDSLTEDMQQNSTMGQLSSNSSLFTNLIAS